MNLASDCLERKCPLPALAVLAAVLPLAFAAPASAQTWERTNPGGGGSFISVGAGPDGTIVVGSDLSGAYLSRNRGVSWEVLGASRGVTETHIPGVGFDPANASRIFLGAEAGIFLSEDAGLSFTRVWSPPLVPGEVFEHDAAYVTDIQAAGAGVFYAAVHLKPFFGGGSPPYEAMVYRSDNNGVDWSLASGASLPASISILKLVSAPDDPQTVYALTGESTHLEATVARLYRSEDGGVSWVLLAASLGPAMDVAVDPTDAQTVYLSTFDGADDNMEGTVHVSENGGDSWSVLRNNYSGLLFVDASAQALRTVDTRLPFPWVGKSGAWESSDDGATWQRLPAGFSASADCAQWPAYVSPVCNWDTFWQPNFVLDPMPYGAGLSGYAGTTSGDLSDPAAVLMVNSQWVFLSDDGGGQFRNIFTDSIAADAWRSRGVDNVNMTSLAVSEADPDRIYLGYFDMGCWRSADHGDSWQSCNPSLPDAPGGEYFGWPEGRGGNVASIVADPQRAQVVWSTMSLFQNGEFPTYLLRSDQAGERESWVMVGAGLGLREIQGLSLDRTSPSTQRTLFATAQGDVYKSVDDGSNWSQVLDCSGACNATAVDHFNGQLVYAAGAGGVWRSTNGGQTWTAVGLAQMGGNPNIGFWDFGWEGVFDVIPDPHQTDTVYVTAFGDGKGLYRSTNAGGSWEKLWSDDFMRSMTVAPSNPGLLWATSSSAMESGGLDAGSNGVLLSADAGASWQSMNGDMPWPFAIPVHMDEGNTVFVGSPGTGFQRLTLQDGDADTIPDLLDNCSALANPAQRDTNGDGFGNACDPDLDDNGVVDFADLALLKQAFFAQGDLDEDFDGDGSVNFADLSIMKGFFFGPPGPAAQ